MKPCPFCGAEPHYFYIERLDGHRIMCINQECPVSPTTRNRHTKAEAIADWDTRAEVEP